MTDDLISRTAALDAAPRCGACGWHDAIRALPAIAASQPADPAVKPNSCQQMRVKPLVWFPASGNEKLCNDHWMASAFCGAYHMSPDEDSCCGTWLLQWTLRASDFCMKYGGEITIHSGPEAAKAAAQADYEQRILAAIEMQPMTDALHRSFPDASDGRPMPPMGDELMIAGLSAEDARFVAVQLAQNGLTLCAAIETQPDPRDAVIAQLVEAVEACVTSMEHADMSDGVCCCGDNIDDHSDPMSCGHAPVDMGDYHASKAIAAAHAAVAAAKGSDA